MRSGSPWGIAHVCVLLATAPACRGPGQSIVDVRDALTRADVAAALAVVDAPECHPMTADLANWRCLQSLATVLGGHAGFAPGSPDAASLAAVGVWLLKSKHGEWIPKSDAWLAAIAGADGPGADTLRLAVATAMADEAKVVRKPLRDESTGRAFLAAVARAIPGACETYAALGRGVAIGDVLPADTPELSPCVAHDVDREPGANAGFQTGWPRAVSAAVLLWEAESRALDLGQDRMTGPSRIALGTKMALVRPATMDLGTAWASAGRQGLDGSVVKVPPGSAGATRP